MTECNDISKQSQPDEVAAYRAKLRDVVSRAILHSINVRRLEFDEEADAAIDAVLKFLAEEEPPHPILKRSNGANIMFRAVITDLSSDGGAQ